MHDEEMLALVSDYEAFCSDMSLLPKDEYTVFVPPCGQSFEENEEFRLYYCPATWTRRNAKYLGIYKDKRVRAIGQIVKVVACNVNLDANTATILPNGAETLTAEEEQRILGASRKAQKRGWDISAVSSAMSLPNSAGGGVRIPRPVGDSLVAFSGPLGGSSQRSRRIHGLSLAGFLGTGAQGWR
jgi:hypothetical protein